jgi:energy-coupling factor transport system permease protein
MLTALNPLTKLAMSLIWLLGSMLIFNAQFQVACILLPAAALVVFNRTSPLLLLALMIPFGLFGMGFWTTNLLFHRDSGYAVQVARETIVGSVEFSAGAVLFLRAIACGMISAFFVLTTDAAALVRALLFYGRLPPRLGYALFAGKQLVPDLVFEIHEMRLARAMKSGRSIRRLPGLGEAVSLVVPLLAFAIRRAGNIAISLEARGLAPNGRRTILHVPSFGRGDVVFGVAAALLGFTTVLLLT